MASLSDSQGGPGPGGRGLAQGAVEDLQDILADTLEDTKFYESKQVLESRAVGLMQAKIALLSSAAEAGLQNLEKDHSDMTQQLRLEIADRECQLVSARADTDQWKRRAGVLFLKMSSIQEDVDMYSMRCHLLEAEVLRESSHAKQCESKADGLQKELAACQKHLQASQDHIQALQAELHEAHKIAEVLQRQATMVRAELEGSKQAAAAHARTAAQELADAQADHQSAVAAAAAASKAAEAAERRCEELQWRLQQQDVALADRAKLAEEARAATEGLSKEGIQAVREKASFVERELREQLADVRGYLEEERQQRRSAETSLARQLQQAQADASALRARLAAAEETQGQREARHALDVVSSLVQDLAPPDSIAWQGKPDCAVHSSSYKAQLQDSEKIAADTEQQPVKAQSDAKCAAKREVARAAPRQEKVPADETAKGGAAKKKAARGKAETDGTPADDAANGSPPPAGTAAGRPHRRRASKNPWWMAQADAAAADSGAEDMETDMDDSVSNAAAAQNLQEESGYEPLAGKEPQARKLVRHVAPPETVAEDPIPGVEIEVPAADAQKPRGKKRKVPPRKDPTTDAPAPKAANDGPASKRTRRNADGQKESSSSQAASAAANRADLEEAAPKGRAGRKAKASAKSSAGNEGTGEAVAADRVGNKADLRETAAVMATETVASDAAPADGPAEGAVEGAAAMQTECSQANAADGFAGEVAPDVAKAAAAYVLAQPKDPKQSSRAARQQAAEPAKAAAKDAQEACPGRQVAGWDKARPAGVSKIDLTAVWGHAPTPLAGAESAPSGGAKDKENPAQAAALAGIIKPVPGRSRFNSAVEANPLASLNPRVLEAAGAMRPSYVSGLAAPSRPSDGGQAPAGKRKLLPAPRPLGAVGALSQDVLFGQGFKVPKLGRH